MLWGIAGDDKERADEKSKQVQKGKLAANAKATDLMLELTVDDLKQIANLHGLRGYGRTKASILNAIMNADVGPTTKQLNYMADLRRKLAQHGHRAAIERESLHSRTAASQWLNKHEEKLNEFAPKAA